ncbi:MAG TPA: FtsX-like permease family protein, partial [Gemmatimonadales bacterium]|nr:FtsX-like permease family protein [Gemmatimonadales bacterium]
MKRLRWILAMAWRESRAAPRRLVLMTAAVAVGVGALVAINGFADNLRVSVQEQARSLLGGDLGLSSRQPFSPEGERLIRMLQGGGDSTRAPAGQVAKVTGFAGMAYVTRTSGARLVQVSAIEGAWPFYGTVRTEPANIWPLLQSGRNVIVDPALLTTLDARVGDTLALGESRFVIIGAAVQVPGDVGVRSAFAPRIFIPADYLAETKLLSFGARAFYDAYVKLPDPSRAEILSGQFEQRLRAEKLRVRTVSDDEQDLNQALGTMTRYLGLVALIALLLGGIGVASATHEFINRKLETVAVLRCLGATAPQVFGVYVTQALGVGLLGSAAGVTLGVLLQLALPQVLSGVLPVEVAVTMSPEAILLGLAVGLWASFVFALRPLLTVRRISPLVALRRDYDDAAQRQRDPLRWMAWGVLALSVVGLALLQVRRVPPALAFSGGVAVAIGVLALAASLLVKGVRRWFPKGLPYLWRQGLANLYRPANQTVVVVLALGFGAFLLGTLYVVQYSLVQQFAIDASPDRPNLILFDIQPEQRAGVDSILAEVGSRGPGLTPIVPMRISSVKGVPVERLTGESAADTTDEEGRPRRGERRNAWAFRREYRSTYRAEKTPSEVIVSGKWAETAARGAPPSAPTPISVEVDLAGELGVTVGDTIVWDVQGVKLTSVVANLRTVNWARFEPNFFVVFPPGPLDQAPQTWVTLARLDSATTRGLVQRRVVERYPNVSTIDLSVVQRAVDELLSRVTLGVRFMALFSLAAGGMVLIGAVAGTRRQRIREGVLLKTLGATRRQVMRIALAEYVSLGLLSAVASLGLASIAGWLIVDRFFEMQYRYPAPGILAFAAAIIGLTVAVGLWTSREVFARTPL